LSGSHFKPPALPVVYDSLCCPNGGNGILPYKMPTIHYDVGRLSIADVW
jgi:hypothetical protein